MGRVRADAIKPNREERTVQHISDLYQIFLAGINPAGRLIGTVLSLGPTETGKTRVVNAAPRKFSPEFVNRIDRVDFFRSFKNQYLLRILESDI
jgi:ATP-dependent Clp protease ATP-binding subunit ClpA